MMRVMSLLCCFAAFGVAIHGLNQTPTDYSGLSILVTAFLAPAFGGKVFQKSIEVRTSDKNTSAS